MDVTTILSPSPSQPPAIPSFQLKFPSVFPPPLGNFRLGPPLPLPPPIIPVSSWSATLQVGQQLSVNPWFIILAVIGAIVALIPATNEELQELIGVPPGLALLLALVVGGFLGQRSERRLTRKRTIRGFSTAIVNSKKGQSEVKRSEASEFALNAGALKTYPPVWPVSCEGPPQQISQKPTRSKPANLHSSRT